MNRIIEELKMVGKSQIHYFCPLESVILYYMMECIESGKFQKITISNVYNIIDIYSKVYNDTATGHERCDCTKHFPKILNTLTEKQKKQQQYLCNHYDRMIHINTILNNFVKLNPTVNWLYNHPVKFNSSIEDANNEFTITTGFPLIGYDNKNVFVFIIKPQFNEINFSEVMVDSILNTWIISNTTGNNKEKFGDKPIKSCVLSLNKSNIYTMDWTQSIKDNIDYLTNIIYKTIYNKFSMKHEQYYNTFECILKEIDKPKKLIKNCLEQSEETNICKYINKFWIILEDNTEYRNKEYFIKKLDELLDKSLMGHIGMTDEEEN
jgi:hypothetical protein